MSVDDSSYTHKVVSKYFSGKTAMDESLTEFQEKKTNYTGPKNIQKPNVIKNKSKKPLKRIKGQKDIRTILKKKKNELISYAKDFDDICKQSGVDVDPEQLQLAIALSKSLQKTESTSDSDTQSSSKPGSQERALKIRTTLQQYGFKVPEIKISTTVGSRKIKKYRKHYKLLSITDIERTQIISDKYSQLLLENLENNNISKTDTNVDVTKLRLFHIASNIAYDCMKDIDTFYVENLFEKSKSTGCLLKNWSDIPGRPESPKIMKDNSMVFSEIECSQDELDVILSGSLKMAKTIIKSKSASINNECDKILNIDDSVATKIDDNSFLVIKHDVCIKTLVDKSDVVCKDIIENDIEVIDIKPKSPTITQQCRSCSPDIFDDEISVVDSSITTALKSQEIKTVEESNNFMDLTECVDIKNSRVENSQEPKPQLSQTSDITKRKSCDFMEITECIVSSTQPLLLNCENIDLTQSSEHSDEVDKDNIDKIVSMDLTQSSNTSSDELPFVEIGGQLQHSLDDTIILNDNEYFNINNKLTNPHFEELEFDNVEIDLTKGKYASPVKSLDDHSNKRIEMSQSDVNDEDILTKPNNDFINDIDLTQSSNSEDVNKNANSLTTTPKILCNNAIIQNDKSIDCDELFDSIDKKAISPVKSLDNLNDHLNERKELSQSDIHYGELLTTANNDLINDIDLTQSSSSEDIDTNANSLTTTPKILCSNSSVDKNDDKSVDYDELFDSIDKRAISEVNTPYKSSFNKSSSSTMHEYGSGDIKIQNSLENISNCTASDLSQNSRVFEIVDQEFDYSLHKSRLDIPMENFDYHIEDIEFRNSSDDIASSSSKSSEGILIPHQEHNIPDDNFAFGGISILNNLSNLPSFRKTINAKQSIANNLEEDMNNSYLPVIDLKKNNKNTDTHLQKEIAMQTPIKEINKNTLFKTPTNKDYIIKTDDVTPMLDYASMSTPERNKELEKYGLKPFKRKRAIQLLTHLYNQTHPIVETYENEDLPSPSKKPKHSRNKSTEKSPKIRSPRKTSEVNDGETQEVVYEESNSLPNIMKIDCDEDDWIFQKREKAKVHSCRVPLHIAFYNYLFSRRGLREAILRYDPINIDVIHKDLVGYGHRYDPKDLLKFMDKKCITVKTTDNSTRNNKK